MLTFNIGDNTSSESLQNMVLINSSIDTAFEHAIIHRRLIAIGMCLNNPLCNVNILLKKSGRTPLQHIMLQSQGYNYQNDLDISDVLIAAGADVNAKNANGCSILSESMDKKHRADRFWSRLIAAGAEVNAEDNDGNTPIFYAAANQSDTAIQLLLQHGANAKHVNKKGMTAISYAQNEIEAWKRLLPVADVDSLDTFEMVANEPANEPASDAASDEVVLTSDSASDEVVLTSDTALDEVVLTSDAASDEVVLTSDEVVLTPDAASDEVVPASKDGTSTAMQIVPSSEDYIAAAMQIKPLYIVPIVSSASIDTTTLTSSDLIAAVNGQSSALVEICLSSNKMKQQDLDIALHRTVTWPYGKPCLEIIDRLLAAGAVPDSHHCTNANIGGNTSLFSLMKVDRGIVPYLDIAERLRLAGADIDCTNDFGRTPLFNAIYARSEVAVAWLLKHGANASHKSEFGTPLSYLFSSFKAVKDMPILKLLLAAGADTRSIDTIQQDADAVLEILKARGFATASKHVYDYRYETGVTTIDLTKLFVKGAISSIRVIGNGTVTRPMRLLVHGAVIFDNLTPSSLFDMFTMDAPLLLGRLEDVRLEISVCKGTDSELKISAISRPMTDEELTTETLSVPIKTMVYNNRRRDVTII